MTPSTPRRFALWHLSRWERSALTGVLIAAVVLRIIGLRAGLPGAALLSPDENTVVPKTLAMIHDGTANPHWFLYPSLYLGLLALSLVALRPLIDTHGLGFANPDAYALDPTPYILTGRVLSLVAGVALVIGVWLLGRRVGGGAVAVTAAALMAIAPMTVAYSHVAVTDMTMTALLTFGLWQLVVAAQDRSLRALLVAAVLIGLATSAKYNAGVAVLPLVGVAWSLATPPVRLRRITATFRVGAVTLGAFLVGTPFALLDAPQFVRDFARQNRIVAEGWLGFEHASPGPWFNLREVLWSGTGAGLVVLALVGLGLAFIRRTPADWVLAPYALVFFLSVSTWNAHFDRYLLPIVPVLAVLASRAAFELVAGVAAHSRVAGAACATAAVAVLLAHPLVNTISLVDGYGTRDVRLDAASEIPGLVPPGSSVATDPLGPPLLTRDEGKRLAVAGIQRPSYALIRFATPQPGHSADPNRSVTGLRGQLVRWVITSDDIERRVMRARERYPTETRFYEEIRSQAKPVLQVPAGLGPGAILWDLGPYRG